MTSAIGLAWILGAFSLGADCNSNGIDDALDLASGASRDCNANTIPDECDLAPGNIAFELAEVHVAGQGAWSSALADLDGDGDLDAAVSSPAKDHVTLLVNEGAGSFRETARIPVGAGPRDLFAADLDRDGDMDIVTANDESHDLSVLLNRGDGSFDPTVNAPVGGQPRRLSIADLDSDGATDCIVSIDYDASSRIVALWNSGSGGLSAPQVVGAGPVLSAVLAIDLDGDGDPDLAYPEGTYQDGLDTVAVVRNLGGRAFAETAHLPAGARPIQLAAGDLDGDGDADLVCANESAGTLTVLKNRGDASFDPPTAWETGGGAESVTLVDLNGDQDLDLVSAGLPPGADPHDTSTVSVLLNTGGAAFGAPRVTSLWGGPLAIAGDLDRDGDMDIVVATRGMAVLANEGNGVLGAPAYMSLGDAGIDRFHLADLDGDDDLDIEAPSLGFGVWSVALNASGQSFHRGCDPFVRGDANIDGSVSISDVIMLGRYLFDEPLVLRCEDAADALDDEWFDIRDAGAIWSAIFDNPDWKMPLASPSPAPGHDPTPNVIPPTRPGLPEIGPGGEQWVRPWPYSVGCGSYQVVPAPKVDDIISLGSAAGGPGQVVKVPIYLTSTVPADAVQIVLRYDPQVLDFFPGPEGLSYEGSFYEQFFNRRIHVVHCDGNCEGDHLYGDSPESRVSVHPDARVVTVVIAGHLYLPGFEVTPGVDVLLGWLKVRLSDSAGPGTVVSLDADDGPGGQGVGPYRLRSEISYKGNARYVSVLPHVEGARLSIVGDQSFFRGDSNGDGERNISDAIHTLGSLFLGSGPLDCDDAADANDDGAVDLSDAVYTLAFLFASGNAIPPPGAELGPDPTADSLHCYRIRN